ncbi:MAG: ACT domain-containing protein [Candidatus Omnitrophica bacterium]|nr:ACT domain-containing protein [Candidatus Omnitrophota bacterium]
MNAVKADELTFVLDDCPGKLRDVTALIKELDVFIRAINAVSENGKSRLRIISSDNSKLKERFQGDFEVESKPVIIVQLADKVGTIFSIAGALAEQGININYIYSTTVNPNETAIVVFSSSDNDQALEILTSL